MGDVDQRILQVNTLDSRGGAAQVALGLHRAFQRRGLDARMAVRFKSNDDPTIFALPNEEARTWRSRTLLELDAKLHSGRAPNSATKWASRLLRWSGEPGRAWEINRGLENFSFPGTWRLLAEAGFQPDVIHCHNLHSGYFDLRALPWLSRVAPVVVTLHDAWLLSGHCAHSLDCERWRTGCGTCPDLTLPPAIHKDGTAENWKRKQSIFARSNLYVVAPSQWILERTRQSILGPAIRGARLIPHGVDLGVFRPDDRCAARIALDLPVGAKIVAFVADRVQTNAYKDWSTQTRALERLAASGKGDELVFLAIGGDEATSHVGPIEVRHVPYTNDPERLALYYRSADVLTHAARAETFGLVIAEAQACGTPVIGSRVGGIPEIIRDGQTGLLVNPGDAAALADAIGALLADPTRLAAFGAKAACDAQARFDHQRQVDEHLDFYREAAADFASRRKRRGMAH
ncbi:MAG TPA: glycosyltransferase [Caulobacteraceae bacterium]